MIFFIIFLVTLFWLDLISLLLFFGFGKSKMMKLCFLSLTITPFFMLLAYPNLYDLPIKFEIYILAAIGCIFTLMGIYGYYKHTRASIPTWPKSIFKKLVIVGLLLYSADDLINPFYYRILNNTPDLSNAVSLTFPLQGGRFFIGGGSANPIENPHYEYESQKYALDILKIDDDGNRSKSYFWPAELTDYHIYNWEVTAPCDGTIVDIHNNFDDTRPLFTDIEAPVAGNSVAIYCKGHTILLAHLKKGSIYKNFVKGSIVETGDYIGKIGNSGNTSEPHLHIHAVKGKFSIADQLEDKAEGVPMEFSGKTLLHSNIMDTRDKIAKIILSN